jgi:hypothetical protein
MAVAANIALMDSSKFRRASLLTIAPAEGDLVITDDGLDAVAVDEFRQAGVKLALAPAATTERSPRAESRRHRDAVRAAHGVPGGRRIGGRRSPQRVHAVRRALHPGIHDRGRRGARPVPRARFSASARFGRKRVQPVRSTRAEPPAGETWLK